MNIWYGSGENAWLSNLAFRPFVYNSRKYFTVEQAYQSNKTGRFCEEIYSLDWKEGVKHRNFRKPNTERNVAIMRTCILESFIANPRAAKALVDTGDVKFTHNQDNGIWRLLFPELLISVRDELKDYIFLLE